MSNEEDSSSSMVGKASVASIIAKTFAFAGSASFSSMVGIVYTGLLTALLMV